ncbi:MAG: hypothetical protein K2Y56_17245 [Methylobacterium sp.]|uniref:hypothetical protein n=1 Tax=Methylobacterium sp. TaxID=409 RepID=UPI0025E3C5BD|nr:hypothetical protein [Methylobacterium sp.]MBX9933252.1 hypothetical protein [Methylobacterium sp.]
MTTLDIQLPLHIRTVAESVVIKDASGIRLSYIYFEDEPGRRLQMRRVTHAQAIVIAQATVRALTDLIEAGGAAASTGGSGTSIGGG